MASPVITVRWWGWEPAPGQVVDCAGNGSVDVCPAGTRPTNVGPQIIDDSSWVSSCDECQFLYHLIGGTESNSQESVSLGGNSSGSFRRRCGSVPIPVRWSGSNSGGGSRRKPFGVSGSTRSSFVNSDRPSGRRHHCRTGGPGSPEGVGGLGVCGGGACGDACGGGPSGSPGL
jgi:hypothetical protein